MTVSVTATMPRHPVSNPPLQGPLLSLAPRLAGYAKPRAALGLSGILAEQAPGVIEVWRAAVCLEGETNSRTGFLLRQPGSKACPNRMA